MTDTTEQAQQPIVFLDTETTGLHHDRRPWEIALIRRETPTGAARRTTIFVSDVDLTTAEPIGLSIGGFYERHPIHRTFAPIDPVLFPGESEGQVLSRAVGVTGQDPHDIWIMTERRAAYTVERITRGATIVGAVPNFDTEVLAAVFRRQHLAPSWHYHLIDIEAVALGWLSTEHDLTLPLRSEQLSRMCDVEPPTDEQRHTAMGDADWVMRWFDRIVHGVWSGIALASTNTEGNDQ